KFILSRRTARRWRSFLALFLSTRWFSLTLLSSSGRSARRLTIGTLPFLFPASRLGSCAGRWRNAGLRVGALSFLLSASALIGTSGRSLWSAHRGRLRSSAGFTSASFEWRRRSRLGGRSSWARPNRR